MIGCVTSPFTPSVEYSPSFFNVDYVIILSTPSHPIF
jgi:hypothetical protein